MARVRPASKFLLLFNLLTLQPFNLSTLTAHAVELPSEYARLEHIIAPRGAYIDTGYKPNQNTRVVMDVTVQGTTEYWFGCWDTDYNKGAFAFGNDGTGIYAGYGNQGGTFGSVVANGRRLVELDRNVLTVNEKRIHAFDAETFSLANNLYLFGQNRKGQMVVLDAQDTIICHGCTICENGTLKRNFVPCVRTADNVVGLYDKVEGKFYANAGQGALDKPSSLINLPIDYRLLDSLEVPKGMYINTGYKPNQSTRTVMDVTVQGRAEYWFSVSGANNTTDAYALCNDYDLGIYYAVDDNGGSFKATAANANNGCVPNGRHAVGITPYSFLMDGEVWATKARQGDFQLTNDLYLFASNDSINNRAYAPDTQNTIICHGCKIYEDGTLKRDFVPCRNAYGANGLYDRRERIFHTLLYRLPAGYVATERIVVPKGAYIDTGYKPNQNTRVTMDVTVQGAGEYWFGCWDTDYNKGAFAFGNDVNGIYVGYGNQGETSGDVVGNGWHMVELDKNVAKVDGRQVHSLNGESFALNYNLYLFAQDRRGTATWRDTQNTIICHGCTISENGSPKRNFVPCVRMADAVAGLYDTVGEKFYANSGSGNFGTSDTDLPFGRTLTDGLYAVERSFAFIAPPTESAITVADGATVALYIPEGVTVALRGGDAVGQTGAGAGIRVPTNSTLVVTGGGSLQATGGKAADGAKGGAASAAQVLDQCGDNIHNKEASCISVGA